MDSSEGSEAREDHRDRPGATSYFIREIVAADLASGKHEYPHTRFPPEPNGYLHIGHAKSIVLNFGIAEENEGGLCNLRFDDTNPLTEDMEYARAIERDVRWLGYDWEDRRYFASDYFQRLYELAELLVEKGLAYVDSLSEEEIREYRGTVTEPGRESPYRNRPVKENLDLLRRMKAGEFPDGEHVLRAKIDMAHPNMKMRDPLLYRIRHAPHYRAGDEWCIYPMYDYTHCLSDAFEGITHSLCTLEFENNRAIYDWVLEAVDWPEPRPRQIEFARLNLSYTVLSKRKLLALVEEGRVDGWDDPRMPTLSGFRNRGIPPSAIRSFCDAIGVSKANSVVDVAHLEHAIRDDLNEKAPRVLGVLRPLKVVVTNYPEDEEEWLEAAYWPRDVPGDETREIPFSRELYIDRSDFREDPPRGYRRLAPGREVRLRYGFFIRCEEAVRDEEGEIRELRCTYDPETRGGRAPDGRKPKGTIHWVSARHALSAEVRLYDRLFADSRPDRGKGGPDFREFLNPESLEILEARVEPSLGDTDAGSRWQFEREGYFYRVPSDPRDEPVFHRIVTLKDTWEERRRETAKEEKQPSGEEEMGGRSSAPKSEPPDPWANVTPEQRAMMETLVEEHGIEASDARILAEDPHRIALFEGAVRAHPENPQGIANWMVNELLGLLEEGVVETLPFGGKSLGELVGLIDEGTISTKIAKEVLTVMVREGGDPRTLVEDRDLIQISDRQELLSAIDGILADHTEEVERFRSGEDRLLGFFMGRIMQATEGKAHPETAKELLRERLGSATD
ncbi:MAG: glutamine--tRNA ligase/YqeY domain fusion protein [Thermoanaerobaculia bacterium]|nr:glutamine--tRNA ligase/YqeY domain fusion protein [Thermoanaerobaculia bacterium]